MKRTDKNDSPQQASDEKTADEMSEAEIDANLEDSFPASDAPSWTLGSNHRAEAGKETEKDERQKD